MFVLESPGIAPSALANATNVDPPTTTGIVEQLVAGSHLRRESDPRDRRRLLLFPTAAGEVLGPAIRRARQATEDELIGLVGAEDAKFLRDMLKRLLKTDARLIVGQKRTKPGLPTPRA